MSNGFRGENQRDVLLLFAVEKRRSERSRYVGLFANLTVEEDPTK
jgi:hypothetical protein